MKLISWIDLMFGKVGNEARLGAVIWRHNSNMMLEPHTNKDVQLFLFRTQQNLLLI